MTPPPRHFAAPGQRDDAPAGHDTLPDQPEMIGMGYFPDEVGLAPARTNAAHRFPAADEAA